MIRYAVIMILVFLILWILLPGITIRKEIGRWLCKDTCVPTVVTTLEPKKANKKIEKRVQAQEENIEIVTEPKPIKAETIQTQTQNQTMNVFPTEAPKVVTIERDNYIPVPVNSAPIGYSATGFPANIIGQGAYNPCAYDYNCGNQGSYYGSGYSDNYTRPAFGVGVNFDFHFGHSHDRGQQPTIIYNNNTNTNTATGGNGYGGNSNSSSSSSSDFWFQKSRMQNPNHHPSQAQGKPWGLGTPFRGTEMNNIPVSNRIMRTNNFGGRGMRQMGGGRNGMGSWGR